MHYRGLIGGIGLAVLTAVGCGGRATPPTVPVSGQVIFAGKPVTDATITFTPASGRPATGSIDADGRFSLSTFGLNDGAVTGLHRVTFGSTTEVPMPGTPEAKNSKAGKLPFPKRYGGLATTDLEIDVPAEGLAELTIELQP